MGHPSTLISLGDEPPGVHDPLRVDQLALPPGQHRERGHHQVQCDAI